MMQVSQSGDEDVLCWCARCCGGLLAGAWLRGAWLGQGAGPGQGAEPGEAFATRLAALLYLWTATTLPATQQTLERACNLWWERLPVPALEDALERFFQLNYGLSTPYHDLPQFKYVFKNVLYLLQFYT
ncbi:unnamed protein product [Diatraea saccharalis]|uniref:Uncharacterized protein n=1 Tax=Diatraea saccharalis TaxID=40085 RepID=A0A9N9R193_9NEOP|nr:unnamed protein product [Diatraea saccharalis]